MGCCCDMAITQPDIELQDIRNTSDFEAQILAPTRARFTWRNSLLSERVQAGLRTSAASIRLRWSVQWIARWTQRQSLPAAEPLLSGERVCSAARDEYIAAVMGNGTRSEVVEAACQWQVGFLESQIKEAWIPLFRRVLEGVDPAGLKPSAYELSITFRVLAAMVREFRRDDRALVQIVDELYNSGVLIETDESDDSDYAPYERSTANQIVFTALGLITMLYSPELNPAQDKFEVSTRQAQSYRTSATPERRRLITRSKTFKSYKETVDYRDENVAFLLRRFGTIIPQCQRSIFGGQYSPGPGFAPLMPDVSIEVARLNYRNLCRVVDINVEWVDCLSLHLEFNRSGKVLKLFRFPSICLMMCCCQEKSTFAQIFADSMSYNDASTVEPDRARDYYMEVLLSYRLIFGQDPGSAEDFKRRAHLWAPALGELSDPILSILCGENWESEKAYPIYDEIEAGDTAERYSPSEDFPYLGKRLLKIQEYVNDYRPNNLRQLWHNQMNKWNWLMSWVVVILGCLSLLFAILQTILQLVQLIH
ncbi:hypothetical protein V8E51_004261 [Hyaloscypha variabilis]